jgi:hypothetical protein
MQRAVLRDFSVEAAVVHYVPTQRDDPGDALLLTDEEIALNDALRSYFGSKIVERLEAKGIEIVRDSDEDSSVPDAVAELTSDPGALLDVSRRIATHLDAVQRPKVNSSGLLAVIYGKGRGSDCLAVLKMERERGVRFAITTVNGRHVVDLELLRNLTLTDKTKVFKTALLAGKQSNSVSGYAADDQRGIAGGRQVGQFFLSDFLGCKSKLPAAETTYKFVAAANAAFNRDVESPERRGRYGVAMLALLQSAETSISPKRFARQHLETEDRPAFLERMTDAGLDPDATFTKDTELVKVSRFRMTFESGMVLVGTREDLDERVEIPDESDSDEPVRLHDNVRRLLTGR